MAKMTVCKVCGAEMASNAKTCPKCGAKNKKPIYLRPWFIILAVLLVLGIVGGLGGSSSNSSASSNSSNTSTSSTNDAPEKEEEKEPEETIYNIGDTVQTDKYELTINEVSQNSYVGTEYLGQEPSEGGIYVCVDYTFKNTSDKPINSFEFPSLKIVDANGVEYDNDFAATTYYRTQKDANRKSLSDLNPGITTSDNEAFEISEELYNQGEWFIVIDKKVIYKIK